MPLLISEPLTEEYHETSRPSVIIEERPQSITIKSSRPQSITIGPRTTQNTAPNSTSSSSPASSSPSSPQRNSSVRSQVRSTGPSSPRSVRSVSWALPLSRPSSLVHSPCVRSGTTSIMETVTHQSRIVVGVDWGTTYSGVAIVHSDNPEDVDIIKS